MLEGLHFLQIQLSWNDELGLQKKKKRVPVRNIRICSDKTWLRALSFMKCSEKINVDIKAPPSLRGGRESRFDFVNMSAFLQFIKGRLQSSKRTNPVNSWEGVRDKIKWKCSRHYSQVNQSDAAVLLMVKGYFYQLCLIEWYASTSGMQLSADIRLPYCCISVQIQIFRPSQQDDKKPQGFRSSCELQIRCHSETFLVLSLKSNRVSRKMAPVSSERAAVFGSGRDLCQRCLNVWI